MTGEKAATREGLPWPKGDEGSLGRVARQAEDLGRTIEAKRDALSPANASSAGWKGKAAAAYAGALSKQKGDLRSASDAFDAVASAVRRLARAVGSAQERIDTLAGRLRELRVRAEQTEKAAAGLELAVRSSAAWPGGRAPADLAEDADDTRSRATAADAEYKRVLRAATKEAKELCRSVARADGECAGTIESYVGVANVMGSAYGPVPCVPGITNPAIRLPPPVDMSKLPHAEPDNRTPEQKQEDEIKRERARYFWTGESEEGSHLHDPKDEPFVPGPNPNGYRGPPIVRVVP